ncbi:acetyltransferase [Spiroplasma endosymbiont of Anurida maritima]|uniref:acetyltransferase n=1 Tax=Spiroplasma endosymbiont of Anurida maritima TaxID=2967972 RepID=UPI0036D40322
MIFDKIKKAKDKNKENTKNLNKKDLLLAEENSTIEILTENSENIYSEDEKHESIKVNFSFKKRKSQKILKNLYMQGVHKMLFYTDVANVMHQLEFGIQPISKITLDKGDEYRVWTYLEKNDSLEFELENSNRQNFWKWVTKNKVDPLKIAIISLDIKKVYDSLSQDLEFDETQRRVKVFETVSPKAFDWILIKNNIEVSRIKQYIRANKLKIKLYEGEKGIVKQRG